MNTALFSILIIFSPAVLITLSKPSSFHGIGWFIVIFWFAGASYLVTDLIRKTT